MGTVVKLHGRRAISYKAVVRKRGVTRTKTFKRAALARRWINATEAAIESGSGEIQDVASRRSGAGRTTYALGIARKAPDLAIEQRPWYTLEEACALLGLKASTGTYLIHVERFPVPHEKLGRRTVVLKDVMAAYFDVMRKRGLQALRDKDARAPRIGRQ